MTNTTTELGGVVAEHIAAVNAFNVDAIVRARYDGNYDKTNLPDELIMTNYFTVREGKIVTLMVIRNVPADY